MEADQETKVIVVREDDTCYIKVDLTRSMLTIYCKEHLESEEVRQNLMQVLEIIHTYQLKYLLGNVRALHHLNIGDANWLWDHIMPRLKASTVVKWARVEDPFTMMDLNSLEVKRKLETENTLTSELQFETFFDEESAIHWLLGD